ncbi:hypothetical protein MMC30_008539 [Trapelia coarctata]|nr:hypothetical protein [Trapelia coarctata]
MSPPMCTLALVGLQLIITSTVVGFTGQRSLLRYAALPLMILSSGLQLTCLEQIQYPVGRSFLGAASVFLVILYIELALLSRWTFDAKGPTSSMGGLAPVNSEQLKLKRKTGESKLSSGTIQAILKRLLFGFNISLQSRFPGTKWPVRNIPPFSRRDLGYIPGKAEFLVRKIFKCLIYILILRLSHRFGNPDENPVLFSSDRIPFLTRLGNVSASEMRTRVLGVLAYWTIQYMVIEVLYSFLAVLAVAMRITDVDVWPPVFGSVDDAWSIRQFWG